MNKNIKQFIQNYWILLIIVAAKMILQFVLVNPYYELHRDEFLHLDQADHLAFGYISVPPFTALVSKLIFLFGGGIFWVRFFPALFGALTIVFAWLITEELGGRVVSKLLVSMALLFSVLLRLNVLFQPNSFDILIWTVIFYYLIKYVNTLDTKCLWYLAVSIVLAFYNKYSVAFLITGLFAGFLFTSQRKIFTVKTFWKALLLIVLLILPNLIWQIHNHFPVIDHMRVLKENQLDNNSSTGFIESQIKIFFGSLPLIICALIALAFYKPFKPYKFILICFATAMALFAFLKAKDYYALGLFPVIIASGSVFLDKNLKRIWKPAIISFLIILNLILSISFGKLVMPVLSPAEIIRDKATFEKFGLLRWEDGKSHPLPQDFSDMTGWREMSAKALEAYKMIPDSELENTLVFCDNYGQTGALNYYNRGKMKEAYSFNTDYIFWLPRMENIKNVVAVGEKPDEEVIAMFQNYRIIGYVENEFSREKGTGIYLFTGAIPSFTDFFYKMAESRKMVLDIF